MYGIIAENIFGRLSAGNQLVIESVSRFGGTAMFIVDGNGVRINNADISVTAANGSVFLAGSGGVSITNGDVRITSANGNQVALNADVGLVLGRNLYAGSSAISTGSANFWVDASGNLTVKGTIHADGGSIKIMGPAFGTEIIPGRVIFYKNGIATGSVGIDSEDGKLTLAVEKVVADNISDYDLVGPGAPPPQSGLQAAIAWVVNTVFGPLINLINPTIGRVQELERYWLPVSQGGANMGSRIVDLETWRVTVNTNLLSLQAQIDTINVQLGI
jgi:hypothetical protein